MDPRLLAGGQGRVKDQAIKKELKDAANTVEDASNSRAFVVAARAGFAVSGLLHVLVGIVAIRLAFGKAGEADQGGAVAQLAAQPLGTLLLWTAFAACVALALWQFSEALFSYRGLPARKKLGMKLSAAGQGAVFAVIALTFATFAVGQGKNSGESTKDWTTTLLSAPLGSLLLYAIGAAVAITGIVFAVRGCMASFTKMLVLPSSPAARSTVTVLGVIGYIAKGIVLVLTGVLVIIATAHARPQESTGLDGGLKALREQPYGVYLLALVGAGLVVYGLYLAAKSRYARM
ncbi:DUF1206 domain-containing protein [Pseudarthrobacter sp. P1]|uniref:DUF1206 domain-containing protein n=1 Tax=Pseudarthrobacter sp. P1 TaxID=3418418 RepID=UPI003CE72E6F